MCHTAWVGNTLITYFWNIWFCKARSLRYLRLSPAWPSWRLRHPSLTPSAQWLWLAKAVSPVVALDEHVCWWMAMHPRWHRHCKHLAHWSYILYGFSWHCFYLDRSSWYGCELISRIQYFWYPCHLDRLDTFFSFSHSLAFSACGSTPVFNLKGASQSSASQVGLPIPWLIKNGIESSNDDWNGVSIRWLECILDIVALRQKPRSSKICVEKPTPRSPYLMFYTCLLLGMVFGTVVSIMLSGWKLSKFLGACMAVLYIVFIVSCVLIERFEPEALRTND